MCSDQSNHLTDELLNEYLDGELSSEACVDVQQHLDDCSDCAMRMRDWSLLFAEIEQLPDLEQVMDFVPGVLAKLTDHGSRRSGTFWLMVGQSTLALLMMVYGWLQLSVYLPIERIQSWFAFPLQALDGLIDNLFVALRDAISQFLAWSPSSSDLIATVPQIPIGGTLYIYLGIMLIMLWIIGNHYLLRVNGHIEDAHSGSSQRWRQ